MSTQITFLILDINNKLRIVCDVVAKFYLDGGRTIIIVKDDDQGAELEKLLWTWKQNSFIPHNYHEKLNQAKDDPVVITKEISSNLDYDNLILVSDVPIDQIKMFPNVIDFAEQYNASKIEDDRDRYKQYQNNKFKLKALKPGEFLANTVEKA